MSDLFKSSSTKPVLLQDLLRAVRNKSNLYVIYRGRSPLPEDNAPPATFWIDTTDKSIYISLENDGINSIWKKVQFVDGSESLFYSIEFLDKLGAPQTVITDVEGIVTYSTDGRLYLEKAGVSNLRISTDANKVRVLLPDLSFVEHSVDDEIKYTQSGGMSVTRTANDTIDFFSPEAIVTDDFIQQITVDDGVVLPSTGNVDIKSNTTGLEVVTPSSNVINVGVKDGKILFSEWRPSVTYIEGQGVIYLNVLYVANKTSNTLVFDSLNFNKLVLAVNKVLDKNDNIISNVNGRLKILKTTKLDAETLDIDVRELILYDHSGKVLQRDGAGNALVSSDRAKGIFVDVVNNTQTGIENELAITIQENIRRVSYDIIHRDLSNDVVFSNVEQQIKFIEGNNIVIDFPQANAVRFSVVLDDINVKLFLTTVLDPAGQEKFYVENIRREIDNVSRQSSLIQEGENVVITQGTQPNTYKINAVGGGVSSPDYIQLKTGLISPLVPDLTLDKNNIIVTVNEPHTYSIRGLKVELPALTLPMADFVTLTVNLKQYYLVVDDSVLQYDIIVSPDDITSILGKKVIVASFLISETELLLLNVTSSVLSNTDLTYAKLQQFIPYWISNVSINYDVESGEFTLSELAFIHSYQLSLTDNNVGLVYIPKRYFFNSESREFIEINTMLLGGYHTSCTFLLLGESILIEVFLDDPTVVLFETPANAIGNSLLLFGKEQNNNFNILLPLCWNLYENAEFLQLINVDAVGYSNKTASIKCDEGISVLF